jgi:hypothetical protein
MVAKARARSPVQEWVHHGTKPEVPRPPTVRTGSAVWHALAPSHGGAKHGATAPTSSSAPIHRPLAAASRRTVGRCERLARGGAGVDGAFGVMS